MEKSLKYCLSFLAATIIFSCQKNNYEYYEKEFTPEEKLELAETLLSGMGYRYYYQGSVGEQMLLKHAEIYNPEHAEVWRERGIPYLKRGIASGYLPNYDKCVKYDSLEWQGYRGYCTLYFYRDYKRALIDFNQLDTLTPNFTDYPQATSIDYMRGLCHIGLGNPETALEYLNRFLKKDGERVGYEYLEPVSYIAKGKCLQALNRMDEAQAAFEFGIKNHEKNADMEYYLALHLYEQNKNSEALKWVQKSKESFINSYRNFRPYVEEFFQVYWVDILELEEKILGDMG